VPAIESAESVTEDEIVDIATLPQLSQNDDTLFGVLTKRGKIVIYHYALIDTKSEYLKFLTQLRKNEEKNMGKEARERMSKKEKDDRIKEDKTESNSFTEPL